MLLDILPIKEGNAEASMPAEGAVCLLVYTPTEEGTLSSATTTLTHTLVWHEVG